MDIIKQEIKKFKEAKKEVQWNYLSIKYYEYITEQKLEELMEVCAEVCVFPKFQKVNNYYLFGHLKMHCNHVARVSYAKQYIELCKSNLYLVYHIQDDILKYFPELIDDFQPSYMCDKVLPAIRKMVKIDDYDTRFNYFKTLENDDKNLQLLKLKPDVCFYYWPSKRDLIMKQHLSTININKIFDHILDLEEYGYLIPIMKKYSLTPNQIRKALKEITDIGVLKLFIKLIKEDEHFSSYACALSKNEHFAKMGDEIFNKLIPDINEVAYYPVMEDIIEKLGVNNDWYGMIRDENKMFHILSDCIKYNNIDTFCHLSGSRYFMILPKSKKVQLLKSIGENVNKETVNRIVNVIAR